MTFQDMVVDSLEKPCEIRVRIKESKTNRVRHDATVKMGWTGTEVCPIKAILTYMLKRKDRPGPFFQMDRCRPLTQGEFNKEVREAFESAGMTDGSCRAQFQNRGGYSGSQGRGHRRTDQGPRQVEEPGL